MTMQRSVGRGARVPADPARWRSPLSRSLRPRAHSLGAIRVPRELRNLVDEVTRGAPKSVRRAAGAVARGGIPTSQREAVQLLVPIYKKEIRRYQPWLRKQGQVAGRKVMRELREGIDQLSAPPRREPSSMPKWVGDVIDPVVDPYIEGFLQEVQNPLSMMGAGLLAAIIGTPLLVGFMIGRRTKS